MNISDVLSQQNKHMKREEQVLYFDGAIGKDEHNEYFRLYPDPRFKQYYLRIKVEQVSGDVFEYSPDSLKQSKFYPHLGFTPNNELKFFQVPIKKGEEIEFVTIQKAKVGVEYPKKLNDLMQKDENKACSGHEKTNGTTFRDVAYCNVYGAPCDPACQWCNTIDNTCRCSYCCV